MYIHYLISIYTLNFLHELKYVTINCAWEKYKTLRPLITTNNQDHCWHHITEYTELESYWLVFIDEILHVFKLVYKTDSNTLHFLQV